MGGNGEDTKGERGRSRLSRTRTNSPESTPHRLATYRSSTANMSDTDMERMRGGQQESRSAEAAGRARLGDRRYAQYRKQSGPAIDVDRLGNRRAARQMQFGAPASRLRTGYQVAHLGTIAEQRGRLWSFEQYLRTRNPAMQEVRQHQAEGQWLACTGCHMEVRASDWGRSQPDDVRDSWRSPSEVVRGVYRPLLIKDSGSLLKQSGSLHSYLASLSGSTQQVARQPSPPPSAPLMASGMTETERVQPYLQRLTPIVNALGGNGYKVLSDTSFFWRSDVSSEQIREWILEGIRHRRSQYQELIASIDAGDRDYLEFHPIVSELLSLQPADVRAVIQEEIADEEFWDRVAFWATLGITAVLILAAISTPFAVFLGPAVLGTMEAGLGAYMVMHGLDTYEQGNAYGLSEGTTGIYSPEQQSNAGFMQFMGLFSVAAGGLSVVLGGARLASGLRTAETTALARLPQGQQTLQSGPLSVIIDGERAVGTVAGRPDLLLIKEGSRISMYQRTASGELVLLRTGTLGDSTAAASASTSTELATLGPRPQMAPPQLMAPPAPFGYLPAPVRGPTLYQLPLAGGRGVMNMERGLVPTDLGLNTLANQPELLEIWQEAMAIRGASTRGNAYTRYLDAYEAGTLRAGDPVSKDLAADAFSYVQEKFLPLARARGHDVATVHHWNFSKGQYPHQVLDPRNLVPVTGQSALRGGSHPVHTSVH